MHAHKYRVLIFALSVLLIAGCVLMYAYCEQVYSTTTVVQFKDSRSRKLLSIARDATGLIRPKVLFYNGSGSSRNDREPRGRSSVPDMEQDGHVRGKTPVPVFSISSPQSRCTSAAPSLPLPSTSTRKGSFLDLAAGSSRVPSRDSTRSSSSSSISGRSKQCRSQQSERCTVNSVSSDDVDADSSHVQSGAKKSTLAVVVPTSISPLTPAYQSNESIKISRMPLALFTYLQDDVLVLPPGFLNEAGKF